jgi:hypothetical protein
MHQLYALKLTKLMHNQIKNLFKQMINYRFQKLTLTLTAARCAPLPGIVCCCWGPACRCPLRTLSNHPLRSDSIIHFVWEKIYEKFVFETVREENRNFDQIWWNFVLFRAKKMLKFGAHLMVAAAGWGRERVCN